ncbi:MAG: glutamine-hydrolyzing GMP synthase [Puniceicoccales bacterium]|jgi:GMP synthase (glutamine-hydrolysing)|nr:glutamine-hydrolyzing GMP synthase [Puniceicoccales bacterium]
MGKFAKVLIVDYGSQYTQLIARRVRESGVYSEILPWTATDAQMENFNPSAIILSGGPNDAGEDGSPPLNQALLRMNVPLLGICYGMQLLALHFGGRLENGKDREYGQTALTVLGNSPLWNDIPRLPIAVWMSHGNRVAAIPENFTVSAKTPSVDIAAMADDERRIYGLQFHPEVSHTAQGMQILKNFLFGIAKLKGDWDIGSFADAAIENCRAKVGDAAVILALSGGVDSSVVAALLHRAIGGRLHCIFVDHGLMRHNEAADVVSMLRRCMPGLNLQLVDAQDLFLRRLAGVEDPEIKRKIIGHTFVEVFEKQASKIPDAKFLAQGTLYPDVVESSSPNGVTIKSHHNVGGLPDSMRLALIEPLRELFKDEVRTMGLKMGLPEEIIWRQPFPGPGLAVRILGEVTAARLEILRKADRIVQLELEKSGLLRSIWQGFAVLLPLRTVGVMGDARTYENVIALRVVDSTDAMTADWTRLPHAVIASISSRIVSEVHGVNRVVYDVSSKPPSTIEWE